MPKMKMDELTKAFFSLQEKKVSTLIVAFLFFCGLGVYLALTGETRDLPPNVVSVIIALITAIAGVNAVDRWASRGDYQQYSYYREGTHGDYSNKPPI